jgi:ABC-type lipoprotein release transport system permease subunit
MSQAFDGSIAAGAYYVSGLLDTGTDEIDKGLALISYASAQKLLVMGDRASELAVRLSSAGESPAVVAQMRPSLEKYGYEVLTWQEISTSFLQWIEFDNGFIWIIVVITMIVVAGGILNTILMGVMERTREFGIIMALGTRPAQVIATVAWESSFLGVLGIAFGLAIGLGLTLYFQRFGIDLTIVAGALNSFYMDSIIYPKFSPNYVLVTTGLVLVISVISSVYPAWYASRLKPIEAIRSLG